MSVTPRWIQGLGESAEAVFIVDPSRKILLWNASAEQLFGYTASEVTGRRCSDILAGRTCAGNAWCHSNCKVQRSVNRGTYHGNVDLYLRAKGGLDVCVNICFIAILHRKTHLIMHIVKPLECRDRFKEAVGQIRKVLRDTEALKSERRRSDGRNGDNSIDGVVLPRLSTREIEVLTLVAEGFPNTAIATRLCVSSFTVRNHVQNILNKLGLHSKAQAVSFAYKERLL
jgi:DNA-binding CsgD family transcriptional regulator